MRELLGGHRRRIVAGLALVVAVAVVITIVLSTESPSTTTAASSSSSGAGVATVERQNLIETDTESGTLSYANPQTVYNRLSGTITWLPSIGQVIAPGQPLYKVGGEPVILMNGTTPAYRDLTPSDTDGQDIEQLNRNLVALDFNPEGIVVDDTWQPATTAGVELLQESLGEPMTGTLSLGQIVFLPGDQLITTLDATLGSTGGGGGSGAGSGASGAVDPSGGGSSEFVSLQKTTPKRSGRSRRSRRSKKAQTLAALIALLGAETAELKATERGSGTTSGGGHSAAGKGSPASKSSPAAGAAAGSSASAGGSAASSSGGGGSSGGSSGGSATPILQTTSTQLVVTVDLPASSQSEAVVGEHVTVELPAGNTVNGRISPVSPVAQSSSNSGTSSGSGAGGGSGNGSSGSSATIPVTITLSGHHTGAGLDQAAVSVNFERTLLATASTKLTLTAA